MAFTDLPPGEPTLVEVAETPICLVNVDGTVLAVHDVCTHALASLSAGWGWPRSGAESRCSQSRNGR